MKTIHLICLICSVCFTSSLSSAQEATVPTEDARAGLVRHLNMTYVMPFHGSKEAWLRRRSELRQQILVANGLHPLPERTPLNAKIFDRLERGDYSVEKVHFESLPGFFVTGNLYRPAGLLKSSPSRDTCPERSRRSNGAGRSSVARGRNPAILNPHGHWRDGRLANEEAGSVPARCISQAKMGFVAFSWDMVGRVDSLQIPHNFPGRPLWGLSLMGLQTWNSIRALDFVQSLPDVDPKRIAVTGESGGGTQTFLLTAVDDRVQWAAPVNMISAHMQGGCLCENAPGLRIDTNNMEIAALFAPKPMLLVSCTGDWTVNTPHIEYPGIRSAYELLGATDRLSWVQMVAGHNYNRPSREAVYGFLAHWILNQGDGKPIPEPSLNVEKAADLRVFPDNKPPAGAKTAEEITQYWIEQSEKQLQSAKPSNRASLQRFRETYEPALRHSLAAQIPRSEEIAIYGLRHSESANEFRWQDFYLGRAIVGDRIPAAIALGGRGSPKDPGGRRATGKQTQAMLFIHPLGKEALKNADRYPGSLAKACWEKGQTVLTIDAFNTGGAKATRPDRGYFTTYNRTDTAERVQDILAALVYLRSRANVRSVTLVGLDEFGPLTLLANGVAAGLADRCLIDAMQFNNTSDEAFQQSLFTPSLRRAGDLRTAMALSAPRPLFIHNLAEAFRVDWAEDTYRAARAQRKLMIEKTPATEREIVEWVTKG